MKLFRCETCEQMLYFENSVCVRCGSALGFRPDVLQLITMTTGADGSRAATTGEAWRPCANASAAGCNWLVPVDDEEGFCAACRLNRTIPDLSLDANLGKWQRIEAAKRRLVYSLARFGLPIVGHADAAHGLAFDFLADPADGTPVMTGHDDGQITINVAEADPAEREKRRAELGEPYRTLIGHLRHEIGHFYWDQLVRDGGRIEEARAVFGDETLDYQAALEAHYANGAPAGWQESFVSEYATMHPWEDFAETWTHYLHIVDTLDTAASFGLAVDPAVSSDPKLNTRIAFDPYSAPSVEALIEAWLPLTYAVNSLNRSMGQPDLYPFVLSPGVIAKLGFVHRLVRDGARAAAA